jgi:hypothetical protein
MENKAAHPLLMPLPCNRMEKGNKSIANNAANVKGARKGSP